MQMREREVRLSTVVTVAAWLAGLVGLGLGFAFGDNVAHLGILMCVAGNGVMVSTLVTDAREREQDAFDLGREYERADDVGAEVRQLR